MSIRKFGTEPAKVETLDEDNHSETLSNVKKQAQEDSGDRRKPEPNDDGETPLW